MNHNGRMLGAGLVIAAIANTATGHLGDEQFELELYFITNQKICFAFDGSESPPASLSNSVTMLTGDVVSVQTRLSWNGTSQLDNLMPYSHGEAFPVSIFAVFQGPDGPEEPVLLRTGWKIGSMSPGPAVQWTPGESQTLNTVLFSNWPSLTPDGSGNLTRRFTHAFPRTGNYEVYGVYRPHRLIDGVPVPSDVLIQSNTLTVEITGVVPHWDVLVDNDILSSRVLFGTWEAYSLASPDLRAQIDAAVTASGLAWLQRTRDASISDDGQIDE
jgi:hypothetical protein